MIKNIKDLTEKDITILKNGPVEIIEMLDCMVFKIHFNDKGITPKSAKGKVINEIDGLVNCFYRDVLQFCCDIIAPKFKNVYETFGECEITMMYMPEQKFNKISYDNYKRNRFIYCNMFTKDKYRKDNGAFFDIFPDIEKYPVLDVVDSVESFNVNDIVKVPTFSGNDIDQIEGLILICGNLKCKVVVNETISNINPVTKKIYRDIILEDFAKVIGDDIDNKIMFTDEDDYVTCICNMFYEYLNTTDLFRKVYIEPDDLLPPTLGEVGDIDVKYLPSTAKIMCHNKLYMNVLRLLLVTFNSDTILKFESFGEPVKKNLINIFNKINN